MTIYPDFFQFPADDTERAAILFHEAKHLEGKDEKEAYEFVWKNRKKLGWTKEKYGNSISGEVCEVKPKNIAGTIRLRIQRFRRLHRIN